ncbi:MAG: hypothetical protein WD557_14485 [Dehalococcoidia bacterium]
MAQTILVREHFIDVTFSGRADRASVAGGLSEEETATVMRLGRVLFDFTDVTEFEFDPARLGDVMRRLAEDGLRLAICSRAPAWFGVGRQIALWSDVEGEAIRVFRDRAEAEAWLVGPEGCGSRGET